MTLHIGYKSPFRTNLLPTNLSENGLFLFLYGMPRLVRCTPLSAGQIHDKACMVVDVELVTLELARTSRTDFAAAGHPAKGLLHKIMYSGPYFYKIPLQMN